MHKQTLKQTPHPRQSTTQLTMSIGHGSYSLINNHRHDWERSKDEQRERDRERETNREREREINEIDLRERERERETGTELIWESSSKGVHGGFDFDFGSPIFPFTS